jgi:hypothetical protein
MATLEREAVIAAEHCAGLQHAFTKMAAAQASVLALLPARLRNELTGSLGLMTVNYLRHLVVEQELGRLGRGSPSPLVPRFAAPSERRTDGYIPPLVETVKSISGVKHRLDIDRGPSPTADAPLPIVGEASSRADDRAPAASEEVIDLRGHDLGVPKVFDLEGKESEGQQPSSPSPAYTEDSEAY